MFQSIFKVAVVCGLFAAVAMLSNSANAQSGSRLFGGGSGSRLAPAQSFSAPTQSFSAPTQSFSAGSGTRSVQSFAPTSTYQPAAPNACNADLLCSNDAIVLSANGSVVRPASIFWLWMRWRHFCTSNFLRTVVFATDLHTIQLQSSSRLFVRRMWM